MTYYKYNKKSSGMRQLSHSLNLVTKPIFKKRGFTENKIITDWPLIVGQQISQCCSPIKLSFYRAKRSEGTLHIEVYDSAMALELSYTTPIIIEKITRYFGYKSISRIKIIQKPRSTIQQNTEKTHPPKKLSDTQQTQLKTQLNSIEDNTLKDALQKLGTSILTTSNPK